MSLPEMQEAMPYILTTVAGGAAGAAIEYFAKGQIANNQESFVQVHGDIITDEVEQRNNFIRRNARRVGGVALVVGVGVGFLNGAFWESDNASHQIPANVEIVADQSGGTILSGGLAAEEISTIVQNFDNEDINASAYRAKGDEVTHVKLSNFNEGKGPFGNAPLFDATKSALDQAVLNQSKSSTANHNGVLILTNGNSIDQAEGLVTEAQTNNVPLFVVNVESKGTNPLVTENLKQIATKTEGKYWEANDKNIDKVSQVVKDTLAPQDVKNNDPNSPWPKRVVAFAVSALTLGYVGKKRRSMPIGVGIK